jgi:hypothetical protein
MYRRSTDFDTSRQVVKDLENLSRIPGLNPLVFDVEMFAERNVPFLNKT